MPATVDVLIPAFNAARTIEEAVGSIQRQTIRDIRIIVIDDGSTDGTGEILVRMQAQDERLHVISRPNGGIVDALNDGLAICDAEFVARHDADDNAFPERFERQVAFLNAHPDVVALDCHYWHIDVNGHRMDLKTEKAGPVQSDSSMTPAREPYLMHPFLMVRREAMQAAGGYRHVFHAEDADLYWRLLAFGTMHHLPKVLGEYRIHSGSITGSSVINGRISAASSQLAAISYNRRQKGETDLTFPPNRLKRFQEARTLRAILAVAAEELTPAEADYHALATSVKLLELGIYRPYLLEQEDIETIVEVLRDKADRIRPADLPYVKSLRVRMSVRLARHRQFRGIGRLSPDLVPFTRLLAHKTLVAAGTRLRSAVAGKRSASGNIDPLHGTQSRD